MSSQELSSQINYDTSLNIPDSSFNLFYMGDNYEKFFKSVFISFVGIFMWGVLGTTCIFWLRNAGETLVETNNQNCYTERFPFNFIDLYFPYNKNKLPYKLSDDCNGLKGKGNIPRINNSECDNPLDWLKGSGSGSLSLTTSINFPYNYFSDVDNLKKQIQDPNTSNVKKFFLFINIIFTSSILSNITGGRKLVNDFLYLTNKNFKIPSFLIMIFAKIFFGLILLIRFVGSLFSPLGNIFSEVKNSEFNKYLFLTTRWWFNTSWWSNFKQNPNIWNILMMIFLIITSTLIVPLTLLVDTPFLFLILFSILTIGMIVFLFSFGMTLITMFVQIFKLFEGTLRSGKFIQIFGCNINLLICIFGLLIIIAANKNLDQTTTHLMGLSYGIYICYQIFKFLTA
jgi:hypothetical protein